MHYLEPEPVKKRPAVAVDSTITADEWRAALEELDRGAPGETLTEIAARMRVSRPAARRAVERLTNAGRAERTGSRRVGATWANVYRLLNDKGKGKGKKA